MYSCDQACRKSDVQERGIVKSGRCVMVAHHTTLNKDCILRGAAVMAIDISKLGTISGKKHGEPLDDPVCVCGFEKALSAGQLIDFSDPVRPAMDCFEQLSTCQLILSRMVSLFIVTKFLTALVTNQESPAGVQLQCFPDEISKGESLRGCFESCEESLLCRVRQRSETSARGHKYASSNEPLVRACSKRLDLLSLNYTVVVCLIAMRAIGDGCMWNVPATSFPMLPM